MNRRICSNCIGNAAEKKYYELTDSDSRRINILKIWLTIMVVFIHSYSADIRFSTGTVSVQMPRWLDVSEYIISQSISRCAVPAFFLISSILLYRRSFSWKDNIKKKIKTLLVPYMLVNTIWIMIYFTCQHISKLSIYFANQDHMVADWGLTGWMQAYGVLGEYPIVYPLWFIRDLFILNIFAVIIKKVVEKFMWQSLAVLLLIWLFVNMSITQSICFWGFGCFIVCRNIRLDSLDKISKKLLCFIYIVMVIGDVLTRTWKGNSIIHNMCVIAGVIFWFVCFTDFKWERLNRILLYASSYCFCIYLFHEMNLSFLQKICARLLPKSAVFQFLEYIFIPIVIIAGILLISIFLKKRFPKFYSVITGNRVQ